MQRFNSKDLFSDLDRRAVRGRNSPAPLLFYYCFAEEAAQDAVKTHIASFPELFFPQPQQHSLLPFYCNLKIFISAFEELHSGLGVWQYPKRSLCSTKLLFERAEKSLFCPGHISSAFIGYYFQLSKQIQK